ncbi:MAG: hypothetical protein HYY16_09445 [Planctomycetes bacterium]|nr:hypothetical protein [Planctomycetota bacterium]
MCRPWDDAHGDVKQGDWLIDPARAFKTRFNPPSDFSTDYVVNPFLGIGGR